MPVPSFWFASAQTKLPSIVTASDHRWSPGHPPSMNKAWYVQVVRLSHTGGMSRPGGRRQLREDALAEVNRLLLDQALTREAAHRLAQEKIGPAAAELRLPQPLRARRARLGSNPGLMEQFDTP